MPTRNERQQKRLFNQVSKTRFLTVHGDWMLTWIKVAMTTVMTVNKVNKLARKSFIMNSQNSGYWCMKRKALANSRDVSPPQ